MGAAGGPSGRATPGPDGFTAGTLDDMSPSPDDDLDWLYGRDDRRPSEPEPTQVLPPEALAGGRPMAPEQGPQSRPADTSQQPYGPPTQAYGQQPPYGQQSPYGQQVRPQPAPPPQGPPGAPTRGPQPPPPGGGAPTPTKRKRPVRRVLTVLAALLAALLVWLIAVPVYAWSRIDRVDDVPAGDRPANQPGTTFLLVGSDSREGLTKAQKKKLGTGSTAGQRTDTIMILSIPPGGKPALISIPRDSYVPIPGNGTNKINAAYAFGGPELLVATVEQNTGLRIDAYTEIGFGGFVTVIDALGGIEMCLPKAIKDKDSHLNLKKGCQTLSGTNALGYVRMRKADPLGDLGRVQRQRQMLAAIAKEAASPLTVVNPVRYWNLSTATADAVSIGDDTTFLEMAKMANAMRKVSSGGGFTLTVPVADPGASTPVGSAVLWDEEQAKAMFAEVARGDTSDLKKYAK
jgi:LCP family protein required for cell wall assembly